MESFTFTERVERWGVFECTLTAQIQKNPFTDQKIQGTFTSRSEQKDVDGFYDGNGEFRVRFMPSFEETYTFEISLDSTEVTWEGEFSVSPAGKGNHGPVRVADTFHFAYEDGTPHRPIGTTCYVWELQSEELQKQTLKTLSEGYFNKIRFCIFPKHYDYNLNEPISYPYEGTPMDSSVLTSDNFNLYTGKTEGNSWDFTRFNPEHFRGIERSILALQELGIEADIIVMHPYDRWGFSSMSEEEDDLYWTYLLSRLSAFRNVWWSLANEYDLMETKSIADWERYANLITVHDPYSHLRSIHNCKNFYDFSRPWITHCSIQRTQMYVCSEEVDQYRTRYKKPVVLDEIGYEGTIQHGWGNLSGKELVRRFWEAACRGGYGGHGETYYREDRILWWSHGGVLHGESQERIRFLREIIEDIPTTGLKYLPGRSDEICAIPDIFTPGSVKVYDYYLIYYGYTRPSFKEYYFDDESTFSVEVIDTWDMRVENRGTFTGKFRIDLPGKEYMALRIRRV